MPLILPYNGIMPTIHPSAFIAENATIIGDVEIGAEASIWYNVVVRGDVSHIRIGARSNIQDGAIVHCTEVPNAPTLIGEGVTVGHLAMLHGCTLEDYSFVGMNTIIMDGATVETGGMAAAGAMVTMHKRVRAGELWAGSPAKHIRAMKEEEAKWILTSADNYVRFGREHKKLVSSPR